MSLLEDLNEALSIQRKNLGDNNEWVGDGLGVDHKDDAESIFNKEGSFGATTGIRSGSQVLHVSTRDMKDK